MTIVGRKAEIRELERFYDSGRPELVIVYGRRRVGKTYLIREHFENNFAFYYTGVVDVSNAVNLGNFDKAIREHGGESKAASKNWSDAFEKLKTLLQKLSGERKVVFVDEMPWLDARKSDFLSAFDYFWNSWASAVPEIFFIGCGSATSWITKKLFKNRGGLHNRVTGRIYLAPFSIGECEEFFKSRNVEITRYHLAECYMIFGGIPYYLNLFDRGLSFSQNVDKLCFAATAPLRNEFEELYMSLFNNPRRHIAIVEALAKKNSGLNRNEICESDGLQPNGHLTQALDELEQCDFIEKFIDFTKEKNGAYYYLKDPFTLFYLRYIKDNHTKDEYFWTNYYDDGGHRAWSGYAFEQLCRMHVKQIKAKLGIPGVSTSMASWRSKESVPGAQIDLLISRKDGVINLCEMKYSKHPYEIKKADADTLERKRSVFLMETGVKHAIHITMITTYGLAKKGYYGIVQSEITMDDLFG
ncbi:MAG: ATP-binding protein [Oscillospiraceae bacterium]|jgi:AAA+ ATPase superfamily predicted ATPase|nr:ATP-binding protein [Oscillospiraceae bacterium]